MRIHQRKLMQLDKEHMAQISRYQFTNGSKTENTNHILNERLKEFIGEGKRWWDLVRAVVIMFMMKFQL